MTTEGRDALRPGLPIFLTAVLFLSGQACRPAHHAKETLPTWVVIRSGPDFPPRLAEAFGRLRATSSGALLLHELEAAGKPVVFRPWTLPSGTADRKAEGAVVWWNPDFGAPESPSFVILYHELVHVFQDLRGPDNEDFSAEDEAMGLGRFAAAPYSENALRRELGLPQRSSHDALPGITEEELARRFHDAYADKDYARKRMAPPLPRESLFPRIEATIPPWEDESNGK